MKSLTTFKIGIYPIMIIAGLFTIVGMFILAYLFFIGDIVTKLFIGSAFGVTVLGFWVIFWLLKSDSLQTEEDKE